MAFIEYLSFGILQTMIQNQVYSLPPRYRTLYTDTGGATIIQSNDVAFGTSTAVGLSAGSGNPVAAFIKCTSGNIIVNLIP